ncbi:MAG: response regulator transcription factor [Methylotenera sp.]|nr:response regulator transcription factor [Methylotenera sp.]
MNNNNFVESGDSQTPLTILLVEDDRLTVSLLEYLFARHGFLVRVARDGREAQAIIESNETPPNLVLLDLMLPYLDGYELLQLAKKQAAWVQVPMLVLSGKSQEDDIVRAFKLGASDYVAKPFHPNELIARIERLVK